MKIFFLILLSFTGFAAFAQDSWKVCLNKKILLTASTEDAEKNIIHLSPSNLKKSKQLEVIYTEASPQKGWQRTIALYNNNDFELKQQTTKRFTIKTLELLALFQKFKILNVYTMSLPTDPKMKAQVRIRRVHLCTLVLN